MENQPQLHAIPLPNSSTPCFGIFTDFKHGVSFMLGIHGEYTPPQPPPTPDGGTPMGGNVIPFKRKTITKSSNQVYGEPLRKVA